MASWGQYRSRAFAGAPTARTDERRDLVIGGVARGRESFVSEKSVESAVGPQHLAAAVADARDDVLVVDARGGAESVYEIVEIDLATLEPVSST